MAFEGTLEKFAFQGNKEKTFIDKMLGRQDVDKIASIMKSAELTRDQLSELLYYINATEVKLVNFDGWDRYVCGKYYVWIREFVKQDELIFDYEEKLKALQSDPAQLKKEGIDLGTITVVLSNIKEIKRKMEHNIKFCVDVYLYLMRSSLSLGGSTLDKFTTNKFEYNYSGETPLMPQQPNLKK